MLGLAAGFAAGLADQHLRAAAESGQRKLGESGRRCAPGSVPSRLLKTKSLPVKLSAGDLKTDSPAEMGT